LSLTLGFPFLSLEDPNDIQKSLNKGIQPFPKVFQGKQSFPNKNTIWNKKYLFKKKNHFETKNANLTKNAKHFLFQKGFFFVNHFLKRYKLCVVSLPSKRFFFLSTIFCQLSTFPSLFEEKEGFPTFSKGLPRETHFSGTFPNKNGIFEKIQGFPKENLCRGPPFKNFGKGYQVRKLVYLPFHPFSKKRGEKEGFPEENLQKGWKGMNTRKGMDRRRLKKKDTKSFSVL